MYIQWKLKWATLFLISLLAPFAAPQSNVTTAGGTSGYIPEFTGSTTVQNSSIWQSSNGYIGIGTQNPGNALSVNGIISAGGTYFNVLAYALNSTPVNGTKIQTSIPYQSGVEMPTIVIKGYNYGADQTIGLILNWYIYNGAFLHYSVSSFGAYTPQIQLADENGYVVIFINDLPYFERFTIDAYAHGLSELASWFNGWTTVDQAITGTNTVTLPYRSSFAGNVGIGTTTTTSLLGVSGNTTWPGSNLSPLLNLTDADPFGAGITVNATGAGGRTWDLLSTANSASYGGGQFAIMDATAGHYRMVIDSSGNVGIGTPSPSSLLSVGSSSQFQVGSTGAVTAPSMTVSGTVAATTFSGSGSGLTGVPYSSITGAPASGVSTVFGRAGAVTAASGDYSVGQITGAAPLANPTFTGNVGIGTTPTWGILQVTPGTNQNFAIKSAQAMTGITDFSTAGVQAGFSRTTDGNPVNTIFSYQTANNSKFNLGIAAYSDIVFSAGTGGLSGNETVRFMANGNVGVGTSSPARKLEIAGDVQIDGNLYFGSNQTPQSAPYAGVQCPGGDYAESMDVTGDRTKYGPGDILVLDFANPGKVLKSAEAYSTAVAGIYSTKPGMVGRRQMTPKGSSEVPMAMVGVVPTKVTAENGAIHVGDLLVSSSQPGYAMKGTDRGRMLGAVIGKAMGSLDSGIGTIEVLVTLQ